MVCKIFFLSCLLLLASCQEQFIITGANTTTVSTCGLTDLFSKGAAGTALDPHMIECAEQFQQIDERLSAYYQLANDIDFTGKTMTLIGSAGTPFQGRIDGWGYTLKNWTKVDRNTADPISLFHTIGASGIVKNINIRNFKLEGNLNTAALAFNFYGTIQDITVGGEYKGRANVAPLVIYSRGGYFLNVMSVVGTTAYSDSTGSTVRVGSVGDDTGVAGVLAFAFWDGSSHRSGLYNVSNNATVSRDLTVPTVATWTHTGGVVGYANRADLNGLYNYGNVTGVDEVGGVVGLFESLSTMTKAYNFGSVIGQDYVGGVAGISVYATSMQKNYSSGVITGRDFVGGIIGKCDTLCISNVFNNASNATITGGTYVGGIVGYSVVDITENLFTGTISINADGAGGIAGAFTSVALNRNVVISTHISTSNMSAFVTHIMYGYDGTAGATFGDSYFLIAGTNTVSDAHATGLNTVNVEGDFAGLDFDPSTGYWAMGSSSQYFNGGQHPIPRWMCTLTGVTCI